METGWRFNFKFGLAFIRPLLKVTLPIFTNDHEHGKGDVQKGQSQKKKHGNSYRLAETRYMGC